MKVTVLNAQRARGISAKNNSEYDICTLTYAVPVQSVQKQNRQVTGYGLNAQEIGLDPSVLAHFAKYTFPSVIDLRIEPDPRNMNRNVCVGIVA